MARYGFRIPYPFIFQSIKVHFLYITNMNLPDYIYEITISILVIAVLWVFVAFFTKRGRNFRTSRNRKARKQYPDSDFL